MVTCFLEHSVDVTWQCGQCCMQIDALDSVVCGVWSGSNVCALSCSNVQKEEQMDDARFQQIIAFEQLR